VSNWHAGDDSDQAGSPLGSSGVITLAQRRFMVPGCHFLTLEPRGMRRVYYY
jgi:hypothetical protein